MPFSKKYIPFLFGALFLGSTLTLTSCDKDDEPGEVGNIDSPVFMSSNTSGIITVSDRDDDDNPVYTAFATSADADGLYYKSITDQLYQLDRTNNRIVAYDDIIEGIEDDEEIAIKATSISAFSNGREIVGYGDKLIVAQDGSDENGQMNRLVVFDISDNDEIKYEKTIDVDFNLWGIDMEDDDLFAIVDNSDSIAIIKNFLLKQDGENVVPDMFIQVEGIERTHGIHYVDGENMLLLTDIGDASSNSDGGIVIIDDWTSKMDQSIITAGETIRIYGSNTTLGNPVDIDYDDDADEILVADRANSTFLVFDKPSASGNFAPKLSQGVAGISAITFED